MKRNKMGEISQLIIGGLSSYTGNETYEYTTVMTLNRAENQTQQIASPSACSERSASNTKPLLLDASKQVHLRASPCLSDLNPRS